MKERALGILGEKIGMTTIFDAQGQALGVTVLQLGPCVVLQKRTQSRDGYNALLLGYVNKKAKNITRAEAGQLKALGGNDKARHFQQEVRVTAATLEKFSLGQEIMLSDLGLDETHWVDITGVSNGKGFAGVMKKHHFHGFRATHGTHEYFRHGGSIGCRKWPGRVFKGRKMPGHMGNCRVTQQNVRVVSVRASENLELLTRQRARSPRLARDGTFGR